MRRYLGTLSLALGIASHAWAQSGNPVRPVPQQSSPGVENRAAPMVRSQAVASLDSPPEGWSLSFAHDWGRVGGGEQLLVHDWINADVGMGFNAGFGYTKRDDVVTLPDGVAYVPHVTYDITPRVSFDWSPAQYKEARFAVSVDAGPLIEKPAGKSMKVGAGGSAGFGVAYPLHQHVELRGDERVEVRSYPERTAGMNIGLVTRLALGWQF